MSFTAQEPPADAHHHDEHAGLRRVWWQFLLLGVLLVIVGVLAISAPYFFTPVFVGVLGWLLLIGGFMEAIHALTVRTWRGFALHLLAAALYLIVGLFILEDRDRAATVLTLVLAALFFVGGLLRIIFSVGVRFRTWLWVLLNGVVDLFLGLIIWSGWPGSGNWVIGLLVGIDLLFHGWSLVMLGLSVRTAGAAASAKLGM
jgi:uncharacterized membrane protein HdeD (DUF308 family)